MRQTSVLRQNPFAEGCLNPISQRSDRDSESPTPLHPLTSTTMVALVQELIDAIVDEVATDLAELWLLPQGRANLKACSLVSRTFQVQSQRQLFQMLTLHRNVDHLVINLAGSPHLASYVRDLRIYMNFHRRHELTRILPLLSRVRRLVLYGGRDSEEWGKFSIDFHK
jgi:hypothetical protein